MKKLLLSLSVIAALAVAGAAAIPLITGEGTVIPLSIEPPAYPAEGEYDYPESHTSQISVQLELPVEALTSAANSNAPKELAGSQQRNFHRRIQKGTVQWRMFPGSISLQNTGQNLGFSIPVQGIARVSGEIDAAILRFPIQGDAVLGGDITGTIRPRISSDWAIEPNLVPNLNLNRADLSLGRIGTISATGIVRDLAAGMIENEAANIGPMIMQGVDFRRNLQRLWDEAHMGKQVTEEPPSWFVFDPGTVSMGPVDYSNPDHLTVPMGMEALSYVSGVPVNVAYPETLPRLNLVGSVPPNDIRIPVIVNLEELNKKLASRTSSREFGIGGKSEVSSPEIRVGRKGFLIFGITLDADPGKWGRGFKGRIWFEVRPEFDFETQSISLKDAKLTEETRKALPRPAVNMIEGMVFQSIEKELQDNISQRLPDMAAGIQEWVSSSELPDNLDIKIPNPDLKVMDFYTVTRAAQHADHSPGLVIVLGAKGDIIVQLKSL